MLHLPRYFSFSTTNIRRAGRMTTTFNQLLSYSSSSITLAASKASEAFNTIIYTETDEAPALATYSLLPIVKTFANKVGIKIETSDISLAARVIAQFSDQLSPELCLPDNLANLGDLCKTPTANIIKLPNISASLPQLQECIMELRLKGYDIPLYPTHMTTERDKLIRSKYSKVLGSAVNPVLREGNSDRRVALPVKNYAKKNPHALSMWSRASRTHVAHMNSGDFYSSEVSYIVPQATNLRIQFTSSTGDMTILKDKVDVKTNEIIDASFMSIKALRSFYLNEMNEAYKDHLLFSLHLKATMMKISDPIMFGHCVQVFFQPVFDKYKTVFDGLDINPNLGLASVLDKVKTLDDIHLKEQIEADILDCYQHRPWIAMVDSSKGITNLHVPNDIIIDASMPVVIRDGGKMYNKDGELEDVKCIIPDRSYAMIYQEMMSFLKQHGQFDVSTMGNIANVGLMAQKAEEYGSHDKTFEIASNGIIQVIDNVTNEVIFTHQVEEGDIWRMCQTKDEPIRDWVKLAVERCRLTNIPTIFWLDDKRAHDRNLIQKIKLYLKDYDLTNLNIQILSPIHAMRLSCERAKEGLDTISVTGNVLRDYLTDLFPILELGTSAKMLSIVPLLAGGGLFETGAGGSAPKHVEQFIDEGHLRWDSLGEYLALAVSLEHIGQIGQNPRVLKLGNSLNRAIERLLDNRKSPGRKVNQLDNRASNFYLALYWAEFMAMEDEEFKDLSLKLKENRSIIVNELKGCQGRSMDIGGYYRFDRNKVERAMRPSYTFNTLIDEENAKK